jgi:hypothetical protein
MTMNPSRIDPARQVGVFNPASVAGLPRTPYRRNGKFRWLVGEWSSANAVPATPASRAYIDIGSGRFSLCEGGNWICRVAPDGRDTPYITFDPFSRQWIYLLMQGAYGILRSSEGWVGDQIVFTGLMTMIGINCDWRMTWTRRRPDEFGFVNEERTDGFWAYIDEWHCQRKTETPA